MTSAPTVPTRSDEPPRPDGQSVAPVGHAQGLDLYARNPGDLAGLDRMVRVVRI